VLAGLGIPTTMADLKRRLRLQHGIELAVRIGIHTGPVVVGQMGGDARQENLALGETPNLAARLEGLAKPDSVIVSASTRRLLGESFSFKSLGEQTLRGIADPITVYAVRGERFNEMRYLAEHVGDVGEIFGRGTELDLLAQRWQAAQEGQGQMVLLHGEAGIGKSRIVRALTDSLVQNEHVCLIYQCSPYHTDTALFPAFTQLRRAAGIESGDMQEQQLNKLETLLYKGVDDISLAAPLLGSMMGMGEAVKARYGELELSPNEQRVKALQVLSEQLFSLAAKRPVLFIFEDAHWIDPTTLALTELLLKNINSHRVLLLVTARPGFENDYGVKDSLTRMNLSRINRQQAGELILSVTGNKAIPPELVEEILAKADGVPLFVEEITKSLLDTGALIEYGGAYRLNRSDQQVSVPSSLQDSLMARLDRLQSIKVVAQTAACIGRDFAVQLLSAVLPMAQNALQSALDQLVATDLILPNGEAPSLSYSFKHALVRDAAYESQLIARRREVHKDILSQLESMETSPQVLAHHALQAGLNDKAVDYWTRAGDFAFGQPAYIEAGASFDRAIQILLRSDGFDESEASQRQAVNLCKKLIRTSMAGRGLTHADTVAAIRLEKRLQQKLGDESERFEVMFHEMNVNIGRAQFELGRQQADEICAEAERNDDVIQRVTAYRMRGFTTMASGDISASIPDYERSLVLYDPSQDLETMRRYGISSDLALRCSFSQALALAGLGSRVDNLLSGVEEKAIKLNFPPSLGFALSSMAATYQIGRWSGAQAFAAHALEVAQNYQLVAWVSSLLSTLGGTMYDSWLRGETVDLKEAAELISRGINYRRENRGLIFLPYHLAMNAATLIADKQHAQAQLVERDMIEMIENGSEQWSSAECQRVLAMAHYMENGDHDAAIDRLNKSIALAERQEARLWQLRSTSSLAQVLHDAGRTDQATSALTRVIQNYPLEGHQTTDFYQANELLSQLQ
jgi:tetratricopeptide (TPR) repeat protein